MSRWRDTRVSAALMAALREGDVAMTSKTPKAPVDVATTSRPARRRLAQYLAFSLSVMADGEARVYVTRMDVASKRVVPVLQLETRLDADDHAQAIATLANAMDAWLLDNGLLPLRAPETPR
jgi:hypothetical protein